jgi:hypothetical protein
MEGADFRLPGKYSAMEAVSSLRSDILHQVRKFFGYFSMYSVSFRLDDQLRYVSHGAGRLQSVHFCDDVLYGIGTVLHPRTDPPSAVFLCSRSHLGTLETATVLIASFYLILFREGIV